MSDEGDEDTRVVDQLSFILSTLADLGLANSTEALLHEVRLRYPDLAPAVTLADEDDDEGGEEEEEEEDPKRDALRYQYQHTCRCLAWPFPFP